MLKKYLARKKYTPIPLRKTNFGHLELNVLLNGIDTIFLLDTGAASTVIDIQYANQNNLILITTSIKGGGVGTSELEIFQLDEQQLQIGEFAVTNTTIYAVDLSHVKQSLLDKGETTLPTGVIGADILFDHKAIIDYEGLLLFLK